MTSHQRYVLARERRVWIARGEEMPQWAISEIINRPGPEAQYDAVVELEEELRERLWLLSIAESLEMRKPC